LGVIGAHHGDTSKSGNAMFNMHYIITRGHVNRELVVWHQALFQQSPLFNKTEDFSISEQIGIVIHNPAFSQ